MTWSATWLFWSCDAICISISIMWHSWYHQWHQSIHYIKNTNRRCNMTFLFMSCHWHWCQHNMMMMALSMAPLHCFIKTIEMRCNMHFLFMSCIHKLKIFKIKCNMTFWSRDTTGACISITWWKWHCQKVLLYSLGHNDQNKVQSDLSGHMMLSASASASHVADGIINNIILSLGQNNQNEVQHNSHIMSCHWHWCQHHGPMASSMAALSLLGGDNWHEV